jgi:2-iminoacetate synthase
MANSAVIAQKRTQVNPQNFFIDKDVCFPNALMTRCECAMDYGDEPFKRKVAAAIAKEIPGIGHEKIRVKTAKHVEEIRQSGRDFFF